MNEVIDPIDELVARSENHPELKRFHTFHRAHPEVFNFLVSEIRVRLDNGLAAFSNSSLWQYARWVLELQRAPGETFMMNDHIAGFYSRAIVILFPEFNGRSEFRHSLADDVFGVRLEPKPKKRPKNYARRLQWADGTSFETGWRPLTTFAPVPVKRRPTISRD